MPEISNVIPMSNLAVNPFAALATIPTLADPSTLAHLVPPGLAFGEMGRTSAALFENGSYVPPTTQVKGATSLFASRSAGASGKSRFFPVVQQLRSSQSLDVVELILRNISNVGSYETMTNAIIGEIELMKRSEGPSAAAYMIVRMIRDLSVYDWSLSAAKERTLKALNVLFRELQPLAALIVWRERNYRSFFDSISRAAEYVGWVKLQEGSPTNFGKDRARNLMRLAPDMADILRSYACLYDMAVHSMSFFKHWITKEDLIFMISSEFGAAELYEYAGRKKEAEDLRRCGGDVSREFKVDKDRLIEIGRSLRYGELYVAAGAGPSWLAADIAATEPVSSFQVRLAELMGTTERAGAFAEAAERLGFDLNDAFAASYLWRLPRPKA